MTQLTNAQLERLQTALLDAFNQTELTQMVRLALDQSLESIAGGGSPPQIVFNLLQWAQRHQRVGELVRVAQQRRPHNRTLQTLAAELSAATTQSPPASATGITIGKIEAINVGETQHIDQRGATFNMNEHKEIDTGGGAFIGGNVTTGSGDFVGRDKVTHGDAVQGDKVGGDKISVGDITGSSGIAIGRNASASVHSGLSGAELAKALAPVIAAIQHSRADAPTQTAATQQVEELTQELAKGKEANDSRIAGILDGLANMVPGAVAAVVSAFGTPLLGGLAGPVTQFVLNQLKRSQS